MLPSICRILGHDWDGCSCRRCGKTHDRDGCACRRCGGIEHDWEGCTCRRCGTKRDHDWDGCTCRACGIARAHEWEGCTCRRCGTKRDHDWAGCTCRRCGIAREHDWNGCLCQRCGVVHDWAGCTCRRCAIVREHDWNFRGSDWLVCGCRRCGVTAGEARAVEPLIAVLGRPESEYQFRGAADALARLGDARAVEPLLLALQDESDSYFAGRARAAAADALGQLGDPRAIGPLIRALGDPGGDVCRAAVVALDRLGEPQWKALVRGELADIERLADSGDPRVFEPLVRGLTVPYRADWEQLDDRDAFDLARRRMRCASAAALGRMGDSRALEPLAAALADDESQESYWVREAAATALGELGDRRAIPFLTLALDDREETVRLAAATVLKKLQDEGVK